MTSKMNKKPFTDEQFVATQFCSAEEKSKCANQLIAFIVAGMPESKWTRQLYHTISQHLFGHIAHYNQGGFWHAWFSTKEKQLSFLKHAAGGSGEIYGDPEFTWSDVEKAIRQWLLDNPEVIESYSKQAIDVRIESTKQTAINALNNLTPRERQEVLEQLK